MKRLLNAAICATMLAACSDSPADISRQAAKLVDKERSKQQATAKPGAEKIANYDEKVDIHKIGLALRNAGIAQGGQKEAEWNQRLAAAKNDRDIKAVLNEQLYFYRKVMQALSGLEMSSKQGQDVHARLSDGFSGMVRVLERLKNQDLTSPEGMVLMNEAMPEIQQHGLGIAQAMRMWVEMMKANNQHIDKEAETRFWQKIKDVEQKLQ